MESEKFGHTSPGGIVMKISAVFESTDHAEFAARRISESGIVIQKRNVTSLTNREAPAPHLPTDEFYFPAAAEFYTGMAVPMNVMTPGVAFYPMGGHVSGEIPLSGEARLELEIDGKERDRVRELLLGMHGTSIHSWQ